MSPGRRLIPQVDGLRFVAIGTVVLHHLRSLVLTYVPCSNGDGLASWLLLRGHYGVQLFFVLSGFVLALPFARAFLANGPAPHLGAYFLRRVTRLEPPYVVMLVVFTVGWTAMTHAPDAWTRTGAAALYQHMQIFGGMLPMNPVTWSLEIEVQFYVLTPLLARVFAIRSPTVRRGVIVLASLAAGIAAPALPPRVGASVAGFMSFFGAGYLLSDLYVARWREAPQRSWRWDLASIAGWPLLVALTLYEAAVPALMPFVICGLYAAALRGRLTAALFGNRWLVAIGGMCYSIYLLHYPVMAFAARYLRGVGAGWQFGSIVALHTAILMPLVLVVCTAYFVAIERPCMNPRWPALLAARVRRALPSGAASKTWQ